MKVFLFFLEHGSFKLRGVNFTDRLQYYFGTPTANEGPLREAVFIYYHMISIEDVVDDSVPFLHWLGRLQRRAMSFFTNSSGFIISGGEFVNNEGINKIDKGKHVFVHSSSKSY